MIKIYYGISGTFKTTTINIEKKNSKNNKVCWSLIKKWKKLEAGPLKDKIVENHLNYAMLHLCNLNTIMRNRELTDDIFVERGVTDPIYYWLRLNEIKNDDWIKEMVLEELNLCDSPEEPEKILLIQRDREFIKNTILKEESRAKVFPGGVDEYLEEQEKYIEFTKKYNKITKIIEITNAKDYLEKLK